MSRSRKNVRAQNRSDIISKPDTKTSRGTWILCGVFTLAFVSTAILLACKEITDLDIWWHLAAGRWMWDHGSVVTKDPFSYTFRDGSWVSITWGYEVLNYLLYLIAGKRFFMIYGLSRIHGRRRNLLRLDKLRRYIKDTLLCGMESGLSGFFKWFAHCRKTLDRSPGNGDSPLWRRHGRALTPCTRATFD